MKSPITAKTFPHSPEEITVDWLNGILREAGVLSDNAIKSVEVSSTVAGFGALGSYARLNVRFAQPLPGVPQSFFAKFSLGDPAMRAKYRQMYNTEVRFYLDVAPLVSLRIPRCYFAAMDDDTGQSLLLLEDLAAGRAGDSLIGCSTQEAELLFRQMASFHAGWWGSPLLSQWKWLPGYGEGYPVFMSKRLGRAWPIFRQKYTDLVPAWAIGAAKRALRQLPEIFHAFADCPATFTHGDLGLDNVRFDLPDAPLVLYDWQLVRQAPGARDISWFLVRSLPIPQRRADEDQLVRVYHEALVQAGVHDYALESLQRHIKLGYLVAFLIVISGAVNADYSSGRGMQVITARIERNIAVLEDHDVLEALT